MEITSNTPLMPHYTLCDYLIVHAYESVKVISASLWHDCIEYPILNTITHIRLIKYNWNTIYIYIHCHLLVLVFADIVLVILSFDMNSDSIQDRGICHLHKPLLFKISTHPYVRSCIQMLLDTGHSIYDSLQIVAYSKMAEILEVYKKEW